MYHNDGLNSEHSERRKIENVEVADSALLDPNRTLQGALATPKAVLDPLLESVAISHAWRGISPHSLNVRCYSTHYEKVVVSHVVEAARISLPTLEILMPW